MKTLKPTLNYHRSNHAAMRTAAFVAILALVALMVFPVFSSSMASSSSTIIRPKNVLGTASQSSERIVKRASTLESMWAFPGFGALAPTNSWFSASPSMALAGETVELFAADCSTPKAAFSLGETVCAKTNGVDLTVPGNYYMNWIDSQLNQTNGGAITQNPQYFLFVPPAADTYKATIGRVAPPDSSIIGNPPIFTVSNGPGISTYTPDCLTPKTTFVLDSTVCATAVSTGGAAARRRVVWIDPAGNARQVADITSDPQSFSFHIPATQTSIVSGEVVDNRGVWKVNIISSRSSLVASTTFLVKDPDNPTADVSVLKYAESQAVSAGSSGTFVISVYNNGPDAAQTVVLTDPLPSNTTFVAIVQTAGPTFTCTTPAAGASGTITCSIASLAQGENPQFQLAYQIDAGTPANTQISNTATVSSSADGNSTNNSSTGTVTVSSGGGGGTNTCSVGCPDDITTPANTTNGSGDPGAIVHFSPPSGNEECGVITTDHCNDCFFPEGITTVTGTATTGESCSFTVTVTAAGGSAPSISCPPDKTGTANSSCEAAIAIGSPTVTGTNTTYYGVRSDGKPLYNCDCYPANPSDPGVECEVTGACSRRADATFSAGVTTITWTAYSHDVAGPYANPETEELHRTGSASCIQTITVNDVTPPVIGATNSSASADASCQAPVPDYSSTVSDNCACDSSDTSESCEGHSRFSVTQTPAAGTMVGLGPHTVHITANDGSSNNSGAGNTSSKDVTFTVNDMTPPAITCPTDMTANTAPGTCAAVVNPGTATATDNCDSSPTITATRSDGRPLTDTYPGGTTTITWRATDDYGNYSECTQTITVVDNEPPVIVFNGQTPSMWPPNHSYHTFTAANFISSVSDNCSSLSVNDVYITKVTSDESENAGGSGNTLNDIVIAGNCKSVQLRAERINSGNGRVYTIYFKLVDSSGNVTTGTAKVYSPKNQGETPGDNGPMYTVTSSCP